MDCVVTTDDESLAQRIRKLDPERFTVLCRMHLSFLLDLTSEELEAFCISKVKDKPKRIFPIALHRGCKVEEPSSALTQAECNNLQVLIDFLGQKSNICQEGLFRKSGKKSRQRELGQLISGNSVLQFKGSVNVHDYASCLKAFLADLQEPLLTENHYAAHCQIAGLCSESMTIEQQQSAKARQIIALQLLLLLLPSKNRRLLQQLLNLLHRVSREHRDNRMDAVNLATMFAPHILCPRKMEPEEFRARSSLMTTAVAFMIENAPELFKIPSALADDLRAYWENICVSEKGGRLTTQSVADGEVQGLLDPSEVQTVTTFCVRKQLDESKRNIATATALAELYSHIQSMPDSAKKRHLIKQFNKENSQGTPLSVPSKKTHQRSKSLRKSIKKHLFKNHSRHQTATQFYTEHITNAHALEGRSPETNVEIPICSSPAHKQHICEVAQRVPGKHNEICTIRHPAFCPQNGNVNLAKPSSSRAKQGNTISPHLRCSQKFPLVPSKASSKLKPKLAYDLGQKSPVELIGIRPLRTVSESSLANIERPLLRSSVSQSIFYRPNSNIRIYRETAV